MVPVPAIGADGQPVAGLPGGPLVRNDARGYSGRLYEHMVGPRGHRVGQGECPQGSGLKPSQGGGWWGLYTHTRTSLSVKASILSSWNDTPHCQERKTLRRICVGRSSRTRANWVLPA